MARTLYREIKVNRDKLISIAFASCVFCWPASSFPHGGMTDANGGHTNKATGIYHYHSKTYKAEKKYTAPVYKPKPYKPRQESRNHSLKQSPNYNRKDWPHWVDYDHDCQDTRAEILIRDSSRKIKFKRNKGCVVTWGLWKCPYTGWTYTKASDLDIDHIVPLSHAHNNGGANWSRSQKRAFANDPINLIAVEDNINKSKGDRGPNEWRPPNKRYWKEYARKWRAVKKKYGLRISKAEAQALREMERY